MPYLDYLSGDDQLAFDEAERKRREEEQAQQRQEALRQLQPASRITTVGEGQLPPPVRPYSDFASSPSPDDIYTDRFSDFTPTATPRISPISTTFYPPEDQPSPSYVSPGFERTATGIQQLSPERLDELNPPLNPSRFGGLFESILPEESNPLRHIPIIGDEAARVTSGMLNPVGFAAMGPALFGPGPLGMFAAGSVGSIGLGAVGQGLESLGVPGVPTPIGDIGPRTIGEVVGGLWGGPGRGVPKAVEPFAQGLEEQGGLPGVGRRLLTEEVGGSRIGDNLPERGTMPPEATDELGDVRLNRPGGAHEPLPGVGGAGGSGEHIPPGGETPAGDMGNPPGVPGRPSEGLEPGWRARQIIADKEQGLLKPGVVTQLPGVKKVLSAPNPSVSMPREITVANAAKGAAEASTLTEFNAIRRPAVEEIEKAWQAGAPQYVGPANNPIANTPMNWLQRPDFYAPASLQLNAARQTWDEASDKILNIAKHDFGVQIDPWTPETPGASYVPNVMSREAAQKAQDAIAGTYTSASLSSHLSPAKTRLWEDAYSRMTHDPKFVPETDLGTLMHDHDAALARMAGNETFRMGSAGKNRLEVMQETHPALAGKMVNLRNQLASLRSSLASVNQRAAATVDKFLQNPDGMTLGDLASELDVRITRGTKAGMSAADLKAKLNSVRQQIKAIRPAWDAANLEPYTFSSKTYQWYKPDTAKAIDDVLQTKLNMGQPIIDFIDEVRQTAFAGDFSPIVGVQAPLGFLSDPISGSIAIPGMARELLNPGARIADEIAKNPESVRAFTETSGRAFGEIGAEFHRAGKGLERIPAIGKGIGSANKRMMSALQWMQYRMWQNDKAILKFTNPNMGEAELNHEAWNSVSKVIPNLNPAERGASPLQAQLERAPFVSTSFIMGPATLVKDATSGLVKLLGSRELSPAARWQGLAGREQLAILRGTTLLGSVTALGVASYVAQGKSVKDATETVLNPAHSRFMSIAIPGTDLYLPIAGPFRSFARMAAPQKVGEINGVSAYLPFMGLPNYAKSKLGPLTRLPFDLTRNEDFFGRKIYKGDFPGNVLQAIWYAAEQVIPLTGGAVSQGIRTGQGTTETIINAASQLAGTNLYETSPSQKRNEISQEMFGKDYQALDISERQKVDARGEVQQATAQIDKGQRERGDSFQKAQDQVAAYRAKQRTEQEKDDAAAQAGSMSIDQWKDNFYTRQAQTGAVADEIYKALGAEFSDKKDLPPERAALEAYFKVDAEKYRDPKTREIDSVAFWAERDKALSPLTPEQRATVQGEIDKYLTPFAKQARQASALYRDMPPEYKGMTKADEVALRDFNQQVSERRVELYRQTGRKRSERYVAKQLSQEMGRPDLYKWNRILASPQRSRRYIAPEHDAYLIGHRAEMERFYPNLYDSIATEKRLKRRAA